MQAFEIMTKNPTCCQAEATVREAARQMVEHDCGEIPIVDLEGRPIGVITDRDICCRVVALGIDGNLAVVVDHMTIPAVTVEMRDAVEHCRHIMEENMIRRVPVVDDYGRCVGIISQADMARATELSEIGLLVRGLSEKGEPTSRSMM